MSHITVLGLGAMGSRMSAQLLAAGHALTVWNRSPHAVQALIDAGARHAASPAEAASGAEVVIAMLRDDEASRQVWLDANTGALAGMVPTAIAIDSSTLTPGWVRELGRRMQERGISFLEAPVSGSRAQADAGQLTYLVGGDAPTLARCLPILQTLGSGVEHVGALGHGALAKLATNAMLGIQVTGLAEAIAMLERQQANTSEVLNAMAKTSVWAPVFTYLSSTMVQRQFEPQFPVELMEKDFGYTLREAGSNANAPTLAAAHAVFQRARAQGLGLENMTSVVQLFRAEK
ncbi:NAD(P)-dependent oxidoreductase [Comamonas piscis]|uniref:NAD(P)-dependent oxidoreductase n=1 Tax=Comamonas piscis TaxID=1562974 RepID=A0A7G5EKW9_9BURK|nr:NAD(P)-dependent oxidoreductase [Comamonas piscis]QMV74644.1 NAD(P)-dependent oxidoreductase [Comamonas piscis]WSO33108.1 NAD(P)-dependent oxidoreductase [Comamonas piscis]